jgi:hypothetical protein
MPKMKFKIKKDGTVEVDGIDCSGEICRKMSAPIEEALGIQIETQDKPELFVELDGVKNEVHE